MAKQSEPSAFTHLAADVVSAYVQRNEMAPDEVPGFLRSIHAALKNLDTPPIEPTAVERLSAARIRASITSEALISFEDGQRYRTLKRHLRTHGMTPEQYREKWGLPADYPMVAPSYSNERSRHAKSMGLGQMRRRQAAST